ncbi:hypothetical protein EVAR_78817_1 [Eumeta japonica]|uniref:Reverse transcriptase domain-containing protein n=1 Tax=Eumeta variegata TaxID=151549 RepID=A0A4C1T461_EUMVA|nr:hypothetical protein EVAR_78817_1 [Eumeta japonica]
MERKAFDLNVNGVKLNHFRFADDINLFEENPIHLQEMVILLKGESIETISHNEQSTKEISRRITNGWRKYWLLREVLKFDGMSLSIKREVFSTCALPFITYSDETWSLTRYHKAKLERYQTAMARSMTVVEKLGKWRWTGRMIQDPQEKWSKIVADWYPRDGKRSRGRQQAKWQETIVEG